MRVIGIPGHLVRNYHLDAYLEKFTDRGRHTVEDFLQDFEKGIRQCWIILVKDKLAAVALTHIGGDRMKTLRITHLAGEGIQHWHKAILEIEEWGRSIGCRRAAHQVPPAYTKVAERYGYEMTHVLIEKDL